VRRCHKFFFLETISWKILIDRIYLNGHLEVVAKCNFALWHHKKQAARTAQKQCVRKINARSATQEPCGDDGDQRKKIGAAMVGAAPIPFFFGDLRWAVRRGWRVKISSPARGQPAGLFPLADRNSPHRNSTKICVPISAEADRLDEPGLWKICVADCKKNRGRPSWWATPT
jgi:hypothetical protein